MSNMSTSNPDDDYSPERGGALMRSPRGDRAKFLPIVRSPFKREIDRMMFEDKTPVPVIMDWLDDEAASIGTTNNISQSMLYRYRRECEAQVYPIEVLQATGEQVKVQWDFLTKFITQGVRQIETNPAIQFKDVLTAINVQQKMMKEMGVNEAVKIIEQSREVFNRIVQIISEVVTEEQMHVLVGKLKDDELIANWTIDEASIDDIN